MKTESDPVRGLIPGPIAANLWKKRKKRCQVSVVRGQGMKKLQFLPHVLQLVSGNSSAKPVLTGKLQRNFIKMKKEEVRMKKGARSEEQGSRKMKMEEGRMKKHFLPVLRS